MSRPVLMVCASVLSIQFGIAIASTVFDEAGPFGAVWIRGVVGGVLLALYVRPKFRSFTRHQLSAIVPFALSLVALTTFFFLAVDRAPLGIVSGIEMLGPLTVAVFGRRDLFDFVWIGLAATGALILCFAEGTEGPISTAGIVFALLAAASWAAYILLSKRVGQRVEGLGGLALALLIAAAVQTPLGLAFGEPGLWDGSVLLTLVVAGVLSTMIPFALEMVALRTLSIGIFGLLMALEPAAAVLAGLVVLDQELTAMQVVGIVLVMVAAAGVLGPRWARPTSYARLMRSTDERARVLATVPLFDGLNVDETEAIAGLMEEREIRTGDVIIREGEEGDEFFVVESGKVEIQVGNQSVRTLDAGEFVGEMALMFGGRRNATVVAAEDSRVLVLARAGFDEMLKTHPRVEDKILRVISERVRYR